MLLRPPGERMGVLRAFVQLREEPRYHRDSHDAAISLHPPSSRNATHDGAAAMPSAGRGRSKSLPRSVAGAHRFQAFRTGLVTDASSDRALPASLPKESAVSGSGPRIPRAAGMTGALSAGIDPGIRASDSPSGRALASVSLGAGTISRRGSSPSASETRPRSECPVFADRRAGSTRCRDPDSRPACPPAVPHPAWQSTGVRPS
jgi:hypothetical protein